MARLEYRYGGPSRKKTILVTAGPTIEPIDAVRYISNYSTGRMGFEVAMAAKRRNFNVILISGPTSLRPPKGVRFISVRTARDMRREVLRFFERADCVVMAAAVSDFRPASVSKKKIKKLFKKTFFLKLERNPDILSELAKIRKRQILVGHCLETGNLIKEAKEKLRSKKLDMIVANISRKKTAPFGEGEKEVFIIDNRGRMDRLTGVSKSKIANFLLNKLGDFLH